VRGSVPRPGGGGATHLEGEGGGGGGVQGGRGEEGVEAGGGAGVRVRRKEERRRPVGGGPEPVAMEKDRRGHRSEGCEDKPDSSIMALTTPPARGSSGTSPGECMEVGQQKRRVCAGEGAGCGGRRGWGPLCPYYWDWPVIDVPMCAECKRMEDGGGGSAQGPAKQSAMGRRPEVGQRGRGRSGGLGRRGHPHGGDREGEGRRRGGGGVPMDGGQWPVRPMDPREELRTPIAGDMGMVGCRNIKEPLASSKFCFCPF